MQRCHRHAYERGRLGPIWHAEQDIGSLLTVMHSMHMHGSAVGAAQPDGRDDELDFQVELQAQRDADVDEDERHGQRNGERAQVVWACNPPTPGVTAGIRSLNPKRHKNPERQPRGGVLRRHAPKPPRSCAAAHITETNRIHLVLFDMQNTTFGPYLAATHRILISVM
jgi:hypothetical protein